MNSYLLKGCRKCGGDLARDCGDWICLQCGSCYYVGLYRPESAAEPPAAAASPPFPIVLPGTALPGSEPTRAAEKAAAVPSGAAYPAGPAVIG